MIVIGIIAGYFALMNLIGFAIMGIDKQRAVKKLWRIPEKILLGTALLGGSLGSLLGMYTFRHKTKHPRFSVGLPLIFIAQSVLILLFLKVTL